MSRQWSRVSVPLPWESACVHFCAIMMNSVQKIWSAAQHLVASTAAIRWGNPAETRLQKQKCIIVSLLPLQVFNSWQHSLVWYLITGFHKVEIFGGDSKLFSINIVMMPFYVPVLQICTKRKYSKNCKITCRLETIGSVPKHTVLVFQLLQTINMFQERYFSQCCLSRLQVAFMLGKKNNWKMPSMERLFNEVAESICWNWFFNHVCTCLITNICAKWSEGVHSTGLCDTASYVTETCVICISCTVRWQRFSEQDATKYVE